MTEKPTYEELEQRVLKLEKEAIAHTQTKKDWDLFFESSADLLCIIGFDRKFKRVNSSWHKTLGWYEEELLGRLYTEFVHPEDIEIAKSAGNKSKERGEHVSGFENRYRCKDGSYRWLAWSAVLVPERQLTFAIARDITEHKKTYDALQESENYLKEAQTIAHVGSWRWEIVPDEVYWSDETYRLFGWEPGEEVDYERYLNAVLPKDRDFVEKEVRSALDGIKAYKNEHRIIRNGEIRFHDTIGKVFRDEQGNPLRMIGVVQDINERKQAEKQLRFQASLLEAVEQAVIVTDLEGSIIYWNPYAEKQYQWTAAEAMGRDIMGATVPKVSKKQAAAIMDNLKEGKSWSGEFFVHRRDGAVFPAFVTDSPLFDEDDNLVGIIGLSTDITDRKRAEEALRESESKLRQAQKMESIGTLAGGIAHEFNNILGIIIGNTELAIDDVPEWNPAKECLKEIRAASMRAKDVVRHILSFARKTPAQRKPIQVSTIIRDSLKMMRA